MSVLVLCSFCIVSVLGASFSVVWFCVSVCRVSVLGRFSVFFVCRCLGGFFGSGCALSCRWVFLSCICLVSLLGVLFLYMVVVGSVAGVCVCWLSLWWVYVCWVFLCLGFVFFLYVWVPRFFVVLGFVFLVRFLGCLGACCYKRRQSKVFFVWISDPLLQTSSIRWLFRRKSRFLDAD